MADEQPRSTDREVGITHPEQSRNSGRGLLTAVVIAALLLGTWWWLTRRGTAEPVDLIAAFETARKQPEPSVFTVADVALNGESKRSVVTAAVPGTRLTYKIRVPEDGWFFVSLGLKPEAWEQEGDGVNFTVGISDGRAYAELMTQHVNPYGDPTNRRWIPVYVDISAYSGEEVDLILNTRSGPPGKEGDARNDFAVWGAPEVLVR
jgi:hypothetical protein